MKHLTIAHPLTQILPPDFTSFVARPPEEETAIRDAVFGWIAGYLLQRNTTDRKGIFYKNWTFLYS